MKSHGLLLLGALVLLGCGGVAPTPPLQPDGGATRAIVVELGDITMPTPEETGSVEKAKKKDGGGMPDAVVEGGQEEAISDEEAPRDSDLGASKLGPTRGGQLAGGPKRAATKIARTLSPEVIQSVVRGPRRRIQSCYEQGLRDNPMLAGKVVVRFVVESDGSVSSTSDAGSTMPDTNVTRCVLRTFRELRFPELEGGGPVTFVCPLLFDVGPAGAKADSSRSPGR